MRHQTSKQIEGCADDVISSLNCFLAQDANLGANPTLGDLLLLDPQLVKAAKQAANLEQTLQRLRNW